MIVSETAGSVLLVGMSPVDLPIKMVDIFERLVCEIASEDDSIIPSLNKFSIHMIWLLLRTGDFKFHIARDLELSVRSR